MAWSLVQQGGTGTAGAGTTAARVMSSLTTETLIVVNTVWVVTGGITVSGVADTKGNSYFAVDTAQSPGALFSHQMWYAVNAGGSGANTVTVTYSGSTANKIVRARGYAGTATSSVLDAAKKGVTQNAPGTGTDAITTGATASATTQANDLTVVGAFVRSGFTVITAGTGFANGGQTDETFYGLEDCDKNQATTAAVTGTVTANDASSETSIQVATFKEPASGRTAKNIRSFPLGEGLGMGLGTGDGV